MSVESLTGARSLQHMAAKKFVLETKNSQERIISRDSMALLKKHDIDPTTIPENIHKLIKPQLK